MCLERSNGGILSSLSSVLLQPQHDVLPLQILLSMGRGKLKIIEIANQVTAQSVVLDTEKLVDIQGGPVF